MNLTHCTLTGIDEATDMGSVATLAEEFPVSEWGILYSPKRQGQPGRYPPIDIIRRLLADTPDHVRLALHMCGDGVRNVLSGKKDELDLLDLVRDRRGRVQLNFNQSRKHIGSQSLVDVHDLAALLNAYCDITIITQHNDANKDVWIQLNEDHMGCTNHAVLFDTSGGGGIECKHWPEMLPIACGYAGGLGPDNITAELIKINSIVEDRSTWIDMEGKLRHADKNSADWFNLDSCLTCLMAAQPYAPAMVSGLRMPT